jgi:Putative beta-barrel porin-2, OmpL-like. bbp2
MLYCLLLSAALAPGQTLPPAGPAAREGPSLGGHWPDALPVLAPVEPDAGDPIGRSWQGDSNNDKPGPPSVSAPAPLPVAAPASIPLGEVPPETSPVATGPSWVIPAGAVDAREASPSSVTLFSPPATSQDSTTGPSAPSEPKRRAMPSPWGAPFPGSEYQGYPIIGVPQDSGRWALMKAIQGTPIADVLDTSRINVYGWVTAEANVSTSKHSNTPDSYWIRPNNVDVDQVILRAERNLDSVQTDHVDWGFRSTLLYGIDYRYMTAGGWFSDQLLKHNSLYGWDPTEQYVDLYVPWVAQGMIVRVGRWIACPDIETQFAPDNYMGSHSLLFTFDTYTQTGIMFTFKLNDQWTVQAALHAGTDMAPWYKGAIPTGAFGFRWVSQSNNDAFYGWLNAINNAKFRRFDEDGQPAGHDNFNYLVGTYEHRFSKEFITKTEGYIMWQRDAVVAGTPSIGPLEPFGGGGGIGADIPGITYTFGVLNYTMIALTKRDFITIRNEWWKDTAGERTGFASTYTSNAIGLSHNFNPWFQVRPEIGYYRSWTVPAFDNGTRKNQVMAAFDVTLRF